MRSETLPGALAALPADARMVSVSAGEIAARLDRLPASKSVWKMVLLLSLGAFFEFFELFSTAYVMPGIIKSGILSATTEGFFGMNGTATYIAATFIGLFIGVMVFGSIADRFGRRSVFTGALLLYSLSAAMMAFQDSATGLNFWRLITGIGLGIELVTIDAYLSELVPVRIRGRAFAFSKMTAFLAVPSVAFLSYLLVPIAPLGFDGWRWVVLAGASGALLVWVLRLSLPESPRWLASHGRIEQANQVVSLLEDRVRRDTGQALPEPAAPQAVAVMERPRFREIWQGVYRQRTVMLLIFNAAQAIGLYGFSHWMPTFLVEQGVELSSSLKIGVLVACVSPFGPLLAMTFADRIERKWQIVIASGVMVVAGMVFVESRALPLILVCGALMTLGGTVISLAFHTYQAELYPTRNRAMAIGFVYAVSRLSGALSGFLIAAALKGAGVPGALLLICGSMVVVMLSIGILGPKTRGRSLEDISH
ncbi:MAG: MFS transporter [Pseudomonas sp.]